MPIRNFLILLGLFSLCLAIVLIAWACGSELYLPFGRHDPGPPTHPVGILAAILLAAVLGCGLRFLSVIAVTLFAVLICLGIPVGCLVHHWTPGICQYLLAVALTVNAWYGWNQRDYLEEA